MVAATLPPLLTDEQIDACAKGSLPKTRMCNGFREFARAVESHVNVMWAERLRAAGQPQHARDSAELRSLCQARDHARRERDAARAEIAGLESSAGHLSAMVDARTRLVQKAVAIMKTLHESAKPIDGPDMDACIPGHAFHVFVDGHAELMHALAAGPQITTPQPTDGAELTQQPGQSGFARALEIRTAQGWNLTGQALPVLYTDEINGRQVMRDEVWLCTTEALRKDEPAREPMAWPKARDVGRFGDMSPAGHLRVGLDSDNDVYVSVWGEEGGASVEFCNPGGGGGGSSRRTREALIALMVAMEADNAERPDKDWWARREGNGAHAQ